MAASPERLHPNEACVAAAAGVVMEALGLAAGEAFAWIMDESDITGMSVLEVAEAVLRDAIWNELCPAPRRWYGAARGPAA